MNTQPLDCRVVNGMIELGCTDTWRTINEIGYWTAVGFGLVLFGICIYLVFMCSVRGTPMMGKFTIVVLGIFDIVIGAQLIESRHSWWYGLLLIIVWPLVIYGMWGLLSEWSKRR